MGTWKFGKLWFMALLKVVLVAVGNGEQGTILPLPRSVSPNATLPRERASFSGGNDEERNLRDI